MEKREHSHCWWECRLVQPLWRTVWRFLKKLEIELPYDPAIPLLGIYLEKTVIQKDACTPKFTEALFPTARTDATQVSTDEGTGQENALHAHSGISLSIRKSEMMPFVAM